MSLEASQAELEALELNPRPPKKKRTRKRDTKPRDELGRFTNPAKKGKHASTAR